MTHLKTRAIRLPFQRKDTLHYIFKTSPLTNFNIFRPNAKSFDEPELAQRKQTPETIDYDGTKSH